MSDLIPAGIGPFVQTVGYVALADTTGASWQGSTWWQQLQPGSWRGVGFVMDAVETRAGRRTATHEYPYRDTVWVEDLGKLPRRFAFQAFLVGDDVYQQRDAMVRASEQPGAGTLVHPTMGTLQCVLVDLSVTDRRERGRYVELAFAFILSADVQYPASVLATGANIIAKAEALNTASAADLSRTLSGMPAIPLFSTRAVPAYAGLAIGAVNDPTLALNAVRGLQGYYGRYATGRRSTLLPADATAASVLSHATTQRTAVLTAASALQAAAGDL
jgi:prophage DNA circulation protein